MPALGAPPFIHILCCKCSQGSPSIRFCDIVQFRRVVTRVIDNDTVRAPTDPGRLTLAHSIHSARIIRVRSRQVRQSPALYGRALWAGLYGPGFIGPGARMASHVPCACPLISAYPYVHAVCAYKVCTEPLCIKLSTMYGGKNPKIEYGFKLLSKNNCKYRTIRLARSLRPGLRRTRSRARGGVQQYI